MFPRKPLESENAALYPSQMKFCRALHHLHIAINRVTARYFICKMLDRTKISWEIQNIANICKIDGEYFEKMNLSYLIAIISLAPLYWGKRGTYYMVSSSGIGHQLEGSQGVFVWMYRHGIGQYVK